MKILNKITMASAPKPLKPAKIKPRIVSVSKTGMFRLNASAYEFLKSPTHVEFRANQAGKVYVLASNDEKTGFKVTVNPKASNYYFSSLGLANEFFEELPGKFMIMTEGDQISVDVGKIEPAKGYPIEFI